MKTNGATWKAYLKSWPDGQYFDDSDETFNGIADHDGDPPDDAVVEFTCGVVFSDENDREGKDLVRHFSRWKKLQSNDSFTCLIPREKTAEFKRYVRTLGGSVLI